MRWAKYDALRREALAAERAYLEAQEDFTEKLLQRLGREVPSMQAHAVLGEVDISV
jgi:hypothetical protein